MECLRSRPASASKRRYWRNFPGAKALDSGVSSMSPRFWSWGASDQAARATTWSIDCGSTRRGADSPHSSISFPMTAIGSASTATWSIVRTGRTASTCVGGERGRRLVAPCPQFSPHSPRDMRELSSRPRRSCDLPGHRTTSADHDPPRFKGTCRPPSRSPFHRPPRDRSRTCAARPRCLRAMDQTREGGGGAWRGGARFHHLPDPCP